MALLQIDKMTHYFGGLRAVYNYRLEIEPGQIRGLIGPNGPGKTTIFNLITGIYNPTEGTISLEDNQINGLSPHEIASLGIGRTFQNMPPQNLDRRWAVIGTVRSRNFPP